jgi:hypothetical protein
VIADPRFLFGVTEDGNWYCRDCGAMIGDRKVHRDWHERLLASLIEAATQHAGPE